MRHRGHADFIALTTFDGWKTEVHASLADEAPRGYPALDNSDFAYALARDGRGDHPLFSSGDSGFYNTVT